MVNTIIVFRRFLLGVRLLGSAFRGILLAHVKEHEKLRMMSEYDHVRNGILPTAVQENVIGNTSFELFYNPENHFHSPFVRQPSSSYENLRHREKVKN